MAKNVSYQIFRSFFLSIAFSSGISRIHNHKCLLAFALFFDFEAISISCVCNDEKTEEGKKIINKIKKMKINVHSAPHPILYSVSYFILNAHTYTQY